jgi:hypothetical protein
MVFCTTLADSSNTGLYPCSLHIDFFLDENNGFELGSGRYGMVWLARSAYPWVVWRLHFVAIFYYTVLFEFLLVEFNPISFKQ